MTTIGDVDVSSTIVVNTTELQLMLDQVVANILAHLQDFEDRIAALEP